MLRIAVPGYQDFQLQYLVLDYNGTLAVDGELLEGVRDLLRTLAEDLQIHVLTADTFGKAESRLKGLPCKLVVLPAEKQDVGKLAYVRRLGPQSTVCIGNGRNDRLMLKQARLGIAVVQQEGTAAEALLAADVVCPDILSALGLLTDPLRLTATLRS
jgi:soluble P-type ATPase